MFSKISRKTRSSLPACPLMAKFRGWAHFDSAQGREMKIGLDNQQIHDILETSSREGGRRRQGRWPPQAGSEAARSYASQGRWPPDEAEKHAVSR